ncbi:hypothetical protein EZV73_19675 [Acidaminobacter sp. JC074]|uniref:amidase family protein n=1 Tax=Acidaminobacter sp. JC074 TaxID=2530199 RepID=UPI001F1136A7|nr:amidase family protein [Acidaminobacter sp. JC074]MCH4889813.1 hypothetical protein [Acidaminobacter sp. JC074]
MLKKILLGLIIVIIVLLIIGFIVVKNYLASFDQVALQIEKEVISEYKRDLDFSPYDLDSFDQYDKVYSLVHGKSIQVIQEELLKGSFTSVDLCKYYLTRIQKFQDYNTVIQLNPNLLEEAKEVDKKIAAGDTSALFGVVVLVKDNIAAINMNTAAGAYALKELTTSRDAKLVADLKSEDALIIGKANLSEWSNFISQPSSSGFSALGGQTKNAYGKFDVGGSSSGSSAAAALDLATVTIGTETAGSLIFPAGQNSVVALKPTIGLLSRDLIIPIADAQDTAGVEARHVSDLNLVFNSILNVDSKDPATEIVKDYQVDTRISSDFLLGKTIGLVNNGSDEMAAIVKELTELDAKVIEIAMASPENVDMMTVLNHGIIYDVKAFLNNPDVKTTFKSLNEIHAYNEEHPDVIPFGQVLHTNALEGQYEGIDKLIENNKMASRKVIDDAFTDYELDLILSMSNELSGIYAPAGYPAITLPSGYRDNGEPYGLTFVGQALDDQVLIQAAYAYEVNYPKRKDID